MPDAQLRRCNSNGEIDPEQARSLTNARRAFRFKNIVSHAVKSRYSAGCVIKNSRFTARPANREIGGFFNVGEPPRVY